MQIKPNATSFITCYNILFPQLDSNYFYFIVKNSSSHLLSIYYVPDTTQISNVISTSYPQSICCHPHFPITETTLRVVKPPLQAPAASISWS